MEQNIERLYRIWNGIKQRCLNPKNPSFKNYGARGIVICEEWKLSRDKFVIWALSHGYSDELSLDRIDVNSGYSPDNCRWVNQTIQSNNRRHYWLPKNTPDFVYDDILKAILADADNTTVKEINDYIISGHDGWTHPFIKENKAYFESFDLMDDVQQGISLKAIEAHALQQIKRLALPFSIPFEHSRK